MAIVSIEAEINGVLNQFEITVVQKDTVDSKEVETTAKTIFREGSQMFDTFSKMDESEIEDYVRNILE